MSIPLRCACGRNFRVSPEHAGKRVRCSNAECGRVLVVPPSAPAEKGVVAPPTSAARTPDAAVAAPKPKASRQPRFSIEPPMLRVVPIAERKIKPVETANLENAAGRVHWNRFNIWTSLGLILLLTCVLSPVGMVFLVIGLRRALREELEALVEVAQRQLARTPVCLTADQRRQLKALVAQHLAAPAGSKDLWHVGEGIPSAVLETARRHFFLGRDDDEEVWALGVGSGAGAGKAGIVVTDRAVYYRAFESPYQVLGFFTLPQLASILGTIDNGPVFFMLRDGRIGHFRCDGFEGKRLDLVRFLTAATRVFDPPGSVAVVLPAERLLPEKGALCQIPENCAGCHRPEIESTITLTYDLLIAARYLGVAHVTAEVAAATDKGMRIGGWVGGVTGVIVGAVVGQALGAQRSQEPPSLFTMQLPICDGCATKKPARFHGAGPEGLTVVFANRSFGQAFGAINGLETSTF